MLPDDVQAVVRHYLGQVDSILPGVIEGLYLVGSVALDDYQPGVSDVDFVAVSSSHLDQATEATLAEIHTLVGTDPELPAFEGPYVTFAELQASPELAAMGPTQHDGALTVAKGGRTPVEWRCLATHGIAVRGPEPATLAIADDEEELRHWVHNNLDRYWTPWVNRSRAASPTAMAMLSDWGVSWGVLGVSRMHYTLATGEITSKSRAGWHAMRAFPSSWHGIVQEALTCRPHPPGPPTSMETALERREQAVAFMEYAIEAAHDLA